MELSAGGAGGMMSRRSSAGGCVAGGRMVNRKRSAAGGVFRNSDAGGIDAGRRSIAGGSRSAGGIAGGMTTSCVAARRYLGIVFLVLIIPGVRSGRNEKRLLTDLLINYNNLERPAGNESDSVVVKLGLTLQQIIDVDEKNQIIKTNVWLNLEWTDANLQWNASEYGGVKDLRVHPKSVWTPDILMYNSADELFLNTYPTNVLVYSDGKCTHIPPGIFMSTCKIDITWYPFDDQHCDMKFGSWTYDQSKIELLMQREDGGDTSDYTPNGEWDLKGVSGYRNVVKYNCCPETYVDVTFSIHIRRRTLYYFSNLIMPCVLISSMALLGFTLPPDSGEKLTLEITILLSLTVFMTLVAEQLPQVSDAIPLLATYFNCIMFMVASSVVLTVVVLNYHHRSPTTHSMPDWVSGASDAYHHHSAASTTSSAASPSTPRQFKAGTSGIYRSTVLTKHVQPIPRWVRIVLLQWMPWILRMQRPGKKITRKTIALDNKMRQLDIKEHSSKSLLANVLDIDDDFRQVRAMSTDATSGTVRGSGCSGSCSGSGYNRLIGRSYEEGGLPLQSSQNSYCFNNTKELQNILREIRFITGNIKQNETNNEIVMDWKFAAMVVDRFCLIIFTLYTIISTIVVILTAPHIFVA